MLFCFPRYVALLGTMLATIALLTAQSTASEDTEDGEQQEKPTPSVTTNRPQNAPQQMSQVAVVDIERLRKQHHRLRAQIEELKKQREIDQAELQKDADNSVRLERQLQQYDEESEKHQQLVENIAVAEAALVAKRQKIAEEQERHEARIYFGFHHEVTTEIKHFAQRYGINLVLPYESSEVSVDASAEEILHRIESNPLYHYKIDITDDLLRRMGPPGCLPPSVKELPSQR